MDAGWYPGRTIEYLPSSWCGNSYSYLALSFRHSTGILLMPVYGGEMKDQAQAFKLGLIAYTSKPYEGKRQRGACTALWSMEVINPAAVLAKEREYYPAGLMDPYED
jgi:hypothetical protein